jgi:type 1 fimbria pilin
MKQYGCGTYGQQCIRLAVAGAMLAASSAYGFMTNYDNGRVDFVGRVTDISCSVALNGGIMPVAATSGWRR